MVLIQEREWIVRNNPDLALISIAQIPYHIYYTMYQQQRCSHSGLVL